MKTIIAGSRSITKYSLICDAIKNANFEITQVVCGKARGVDSLGRSWALRNKVDIKDFPAPWSEWRGKPENEIGYTKYGPYWKKAGIIRNERMAVYADALILIWDGKSSGSSNMLYNAQKYNLKIYEHIVE